MRLAQRLLDAVAQMGQGAAQIVRHAVADRAHAGHQPVDALQHDVQPLGQAVELVAAVAHLHAPRQVAFVDLARRLGDAIDAAQDAPAHQHAAGNTEAECQRQRPAHRAAHRVAHLVAFMDVAPHQQEIWAGNHLDARPDMV